MDKQEAKQQGFTHHAEMYGVKGYYKEFGNTFEPTSKLSGYLLAFFIWIEVIFCINEDGFPIKIKEEL